MQFARVGVKSANGCAVRYVQNNANAMILEQMLHESLITVSRCFIKQMLGQGLSRQVQFMHVVIVEVKVVSDLLERRRLNARARDRIVKFRQLITRTSQCLMHGNEGHRHTWRILTGQSQLARGRRLSLEDRISEAFRQAGQ